MQAIDIVQVTSDGWVENGPQNIGGWGVSQFSVVSCQSIPGLLTISIVRRERVILRKCR